MNPRKLLVMIPLLVIVLFSSYGCSGRYTSKKDFTVGENVEFEYDALAGFDSFPVFRFDSFTAGEFPGISFLADMPECLFSVCPEKH